MSAAEEAGFIIDDSYMLQCSLGDVLSISEEAENPLNTFNDETNDNEVLFEEKERSLIEQDDFRTDDSSNKGLLSQHTLELRQSADGVESYFCIECAKEYESLEEITTVHGHGADVEVIEEQQWEVIADEIDSKMIIAEGALDYADEHENEDAETETEEQEQLNGNTEDLTFDNDEVVAHAVKTEEGPDGTDADKFLCEACQCVFLDLESAEQHSCEAQQDADNNILIDLHENLKNEEEFLVEYSCQLCAALFATDEDLTTHYNQTHNQEQHTCNICNLNMSTLKALLDHKKQEHNVEVFKCDRCGKVFKWFQTLENHIHRGCCEQVKPAGPVICNICNTQFTSEKGLKFHMRIHQARVKKSIQDVLPAGTHLKYNELNQFFCEICNKSFDQNLLAVHKNMHQNVEEPICSICNRHFENLSSYEMHLQLHAVQEDPQLRFPIRTEDANGKKLPYPCQYCGRAFGRPYEKVKHERIHTGEKPYECEVCGKCFRVSYSLTMHLRTHTDIRPYVCATCNSRFKSKPVYAHHLRSHQAERAYKCDICPKAFRTSVRLNAHRNSHRKPFSCTECNRPFASLYAVKTHMKTHNKAHKASENLKHRCIICGAEYARSFALRYHMHEAHKIKLEIGTNDVQTLEQEGMYDVTTNDMGDMETVVCNEVADTDDEDAAVLIAAAQDADMGEYVVSQVDSVSAATDDDENVDQNSEFMAVNETERATQSISRENAYEMRTAGELIETVNYQTVVSAAAAPTWLSK